MITKWSADSREHPELSDVKKYMKENGFELHVAHTDCREDEFVVFVIEGSLTREADRDDIRWYYRYSKAAAHGKSVEGIAARLLNGCGNE